LTPACETDEVNLWESQGKGLLPVALSPSTPPFLPPPRPPRPPHPSILPPLHPSIPPPLHPSIPPSLHPSPSTFSIQRPLRPVVPPSGGSPHSCPSCHSWFLPSSLPPSLPSPHFSAPLLPASLSLSSHSCPSCHSWFPISWPSAFKVRRSAFSVQRPPLPNPCAPRPLLPNLSTNLIPEWPAPIPHPPLHPSIPPPLPIRALRAIRGSLLSAPLLSASLSPSPHSCPSCHSWFPFFLPVPPREPRTANREQKTSNLQQPTLIPPRHRLRPIRRPQLHIHRLRV
jgi:hypothetical protein